MTSKHHTHQKSLFLDGEADKWFERNVDDLSEGNDDVLVEAIQRMGIKADKILEIGSANGHRLNALAEQLNADGFGVDPSAQAIKDGSEKYPGLTLTVGTADDLPFTDEFFDLVIFGFCFYLVDPKHHFRAVAEADRILKNGGAMIIFDFMAPCAYHNEYTHLEGVKAYKMDIQRYFTAHPGYHLVQRLLKTVDGDYANIDRREGVDVLIKSYDEAFPRNPYQG